MNYASTLEKILSKVVSSIRNIEEEELNYRSAPNKWSKKEILGHLIDSAYNNHQRFLRAELQGDLIFWTYDQVDWVKKNNYQNREGATLITTWLMVNEHLAKLIEGLNADVLRKETTAHNFDRICMNRLKSGDSSSLSYLIWDYLFHLEHHLTQIIPVYERIVGKFE